MENLLKDMQMDYRDEQVCVRSSASVGVAYHQGGTELENCEMTDLIARADEALYIAKRNGRNQYHIDEIK